jgi:hypothetical protein
MVQDETAWSGTQRVGLVSLSSTVSHVDDISDAVVDDPEASPLDRVGPPASSASAISSSSVSVLHLFLAQLRPFRDFCLERAARVKKRSRCNDSTCSLWVK